MLSKEELKYYARQILLESIGISGQEKLKSAKVLLIGAGGLGCPVLQYITAAGVGQIGIVDGDQVDLSNLHRQILFDFNSIGKNKSVVAKEKLQALNPFVTIENFPFYLTSQNAMDLIKDYEIIVDCSDNYACRFMVNDACILLNKTLVYGAIYKSEGQLSVFNYKKGPSYRCLFPEIPSSESTTNCSQSGVIGTLPGIIGLYQANEIIKLITGIGQVLSGKLMLFNANNNSSIFIQLEKNESLEYNKFVKFGKLIAANYSEDCLEKSAIKEISENELLSKLTQATSYFLDVRELEEVPVFRPSKIIQSPLNELEKNLNLIPKHQELIVFCNSGNRSKKAISILQQKYAYTNLINLSNGITINFIEQWMKSK